MKYRGMKEEDEEGNRKSRSIDRGKEEEDETTQTVFISIC
jgi:hypothetical protein